MFSVNRINNLDNSLQEIMLVNGTQRISAKINLACGGSLQEFIFGGKTIISDLRSMGYSDLYASSVLFPFVNRIKDGKYTYKVKQYQLEKNEGTNAQHGLVYHKLFRLVESAESASSASVTLAYQEKNYVAGFPFLYALYLTYTLTEDGIILKAVIKNEDEKTFPFNVGWHPYFYSSNLKESQLKIDSIQKLTFDTEMIATGLEGHFQKKPLLIGEKYFDDCFQLSNGNIVFKTPEYSLSLSSNAESNYLQVYTPKIKNILAIEPLTGPPNSFNSKKDLQILKPGEAYSVTWKIKISL